MYRVGTTIRTSAAWSCWRKHKVCTSTQTAVKKCNEWTKANPPTADVHSFKAGALEMPISSAAHRRSFPFSILLLSSSIVSLWGSLFRGIHASAFRPQWPPLYKLSACLPQAFGSCFLFFNKLGGVHQLLQWQMHALNRQALQSMIKFIYLFFSC